MKFKLERFSNPAEAEIPSDLADIFSEMRRYWGAAYEEMMQ
jgi:hypothetical protein